MSLAIFTYERKWRTNMHDNKYVNQRRLHVGLFVNRSESMIVILNEGVGHECY